VAGRVGPLRQQLDHVVADQCGHAAAAQRQRMRQVRPHQQRTAVGAGLFRDDRRRGAQVDSDQAGAAPAVAERGQGVARAATPGRAPHRRRAGSGGRRGPHGWDAVPGPPGLRSPYWASVDADVAARCGGVRFATPSAVAVYERQAGDLGHQVSVRTGRVRRVSCRHSVAASARADEGAFAVVSAVGGPASTGCVHRHGLYAGHHEDQPLGKLDWPRARSARAATTHCRRSAVDCSTVRSVVSTTVTVQRGSLLIQPLQRCQAICRHPPVVITR
jgi:hypothetical protein